MLCNQYDLAAVQIYGNEISYEIRPSIPLRNAVRCGNKVHHSDAQGL